MVDTANGDVMRWARSRVGSTIKGKYRIDDVIGAGGMAVVFRATHRNQAEFAIKMLLPELSFRKDLVTRFLREGYAANSVKHPGVVQVVDDDLAEDGAAFLVMELLHGTPVEALWKNHDHRVPVQTAVGIVDQLLEVLGAAHAKGIVHRDIKPANLFLTSEGVVKVLDFGIARVKDAMASGGQGTHTGMLLGTPAFMAPEQAKAQAHAIDAQTDLWAAGATLFTLVAGRFVHDGENAPQLLINSATTAARPMSSMVSHVPPAIAAVVDRSLAFDKTNRWATAEEMRGALRHAHQSTYGVLPTRETLVSTPSGAAPSQPSQPSMPAAVQQTVPLTPTPQHDRAFVGGTTAQPISRQPSLDSSVARSRAPLWVGLAAVAIVAIAGGTLVALHRHTSNVGSSPEPVVSSAPPVAVKSATPAPTEIVSSPPTVAVDSPPSAAPSAHVAQIHSAPVRATQQAPSAAHSAAPSAKCNPPFVINAQGVKVFKEECL